MMFLSSYSPRCPETFRLAMHQTTRMKLSRFWLPSVLFLGLSSMGVAAELTPTVTGVANFHEVDPNVYRGAQPSLDGFKSLAALGVKTIVDLRGDDKLPEEQKEVEDLGLRYISIPMSGLTAPTDEQIANILAVFDAADTAPVFVHCREGKDRTGTVVACYRISHDHWANDKALAEAKGYGMSPFQHPRKKYILGFESAIASR
jgi:tyrosine-protein phosphatase SIW14